MTDNIKELADEITAKLTKTGLDAVTELLCIASVDNIEGDLRYLADLLSIRSYDKVDENRTFEQDRDDLADGWVVRL